MGWTKTCRPDIPSTMSGLGYDLCFFVPEDTSLAGALIEVFGRTDHQPIILTRICNILPVQLLCVYYRLNFSGSER